MYSTLPSKETFVFSQTFVIPEQDVELFIEPDTKAEEAVNTLELLTILGSGGLASVYLATEQSSSQQEVTAVKILHPEQRDNRRVVDVFVTEAELICQLDHPNLVRADRLIQIQGTLGLVMEFIDAVPWDMGMSGTDIERDVLGVFEEVLNGVEYLHSQGIVHCDLKPSNVLVNSEEQIVKIIDLGAAQQIGSLQTDYIVGTPKYMAPEQYFEPDQIGPHTDVYALGVMLYEALVGQVPWNTKSVEELMERKTESLEEVAIQVDPFVPSAIVNVLLKAMSPNPQDRFASIQEFRQALRLNDVLSMRLAS